MQVAKVLGNSQLGIVADNKPLPSQPAFRGDEDKVELSNEAIKEKPKASTSKKWGVGIASGFMFGLGQFINGQVGKGFAFLGAGAVGGILSVIGAIRQNVTLSIVGGVATFAIGIASIVDAVKNAKPDASKS